MQDAGVDVACQRLVYGGQDLLDDRTLSDYNIRGDSLVRLVGGLRGGTMIKVKTLTGKEIEVLAVSCV